MDPFDLAGPEFLAFYIALLFGGICLAGAMRWIFRLPGGEPDQASLELSPYEVAFLSGGKDLVANAAIARLFQDGCLKVTSSSRRVSVCDELQAGANEVEHAVYMAARSSSSGELANRVRSAAAKSLQRIRSRLESVGLIVGSGQMFLAAVVPGAVLLTILLVGIAKIGIGISRNRPVAFLVILCLITACFAVFFFIGPRRSRRGDRALAKLKTFNSALQYCLTRKGDYLSSEDLALALGLFGVGILVDSRLADLGLALSPPPSSGVSGSSCGGSSCGGSSCGGGGGCGGGCGGCGG